MRRMLWMVMLAGCTRSPARPAPDLAPPSSLVSELRVSDNDSDFSRPAVFRLFDTRDLFLKVTVPSLPRVTNLQVKIVSPLNEPFYEDNTVYTTDPTMQTADDAVMHRPVPAYPAQAIDGGWQIIHGVPILGTNFTRIPQSEGAWGITVTLEGVPTSFKSTVTFLTK
jgi:hypothetical protein